MMDCNICLFFWRLQWRWHKFRGARRVEFTNGMVGWIRGNTCIIEPPPQPEAER